MVARHRAVHVTTAHHPLDPRIYSKEIATLRSASIETWLIARDASERDPDPWFLGLNAGKGLWNRVRRHVESFRHLRALQPNVVHIHDPELIPLAYLVRALDGSKIVYDMHENYAGRRRLGGRLLRFLERWCFNWVEHVILAESSYEEILRGKSTPSTEVLNYVRPPAQGLPNREDRPFTLIYTGTIANSRGLNHMLNLAAEIKRSGLDWRIKIVGAGNLPAERIDAERRIRTDGLESVLETVGWDRYVPWSEIAEHYGDAHLGLALLEPLPNYVESIPSKFYEYIYFGIPVIHSDFALWRAFFETNGCGVAVDSGKPGKVLEVIRDLLAGDDFQGLVSATQMVRDRYVWSKMEPRLIALYRDLLGDVS